MKQGIPSRRARGRNNNRGRQQSNIRNQQMDSNGPAGRLRGTPQQILDRYSALARDANSSGDNVLAENLWQHAEHYARLLNLAAAQNPQGQSQQANGPRQQHNRDDQSSDSDSDEQTSSDPQAPLVQQEAVAIPIATAGNGDSSASAKEAATSQDSAAADTAEEAPARAAPKRRSSRTRRAEPADGADGKDSVWSASDVEAATRVESGDDESAAPPRRRRRARFPRQADADGQGANGASSDGEGSGEQPRRIDLPADRSPAALVEALTRADADDDAKGSAA